MINLGEGQSAFLKAMCGEENKRKERKKKKNLFCSFTTHNEPIRLLEPAVVNLAIGDGQRRSVVRLVVVDVVSFFKRRFDGRGRVKFGL